MDTPRIQTAIPQRRYQLGDYSAVVLGDIESPDNAKYQYILAVVKEGETKPEVYVIAERNPRSRAQEGSHRLRIESPVLSDDLGSSDEWRDIDVFASEGLRVAAGVLGLTDEQAVRLA